MATSRRRYVAVALVVVSDLHLPNIPLTNPSIFLIFFVNETKWAIHSRIEREWFRYHDFSSPTVTKVGTANATILMLARNEELADVLHSLRKLENIFNHKYHYPYVFLNDKPFTAEFISRTTEAVSSTPEYGSISPDQWNQPASIDEGRAERERKVLQAKGVLYAESVSYRNMCRFNSGFFFRHELLQKYRYYWRVEPDVEFFCQVHEDPFVFMRNNDKVYGFTIALHEFAETIPTLWNATKEFIKLYPELLPEDNALGFVSDDQGDTYNLCHFWSNFEIADLDFWRSEPYQRFFDFLDSKGGFYYERWGDAPVHSIATALLARKEQIHFFNEIGYRHTTLEHCPQGEVHTTGQCRCNQKSNFDEDHWSCKPRYDKLFAPRAPSV